jgi:L-rhamnonate dehydratase
LWQIVVQVKTDIGTIGWGSGGGGKASLPIVNSHFRELLLGLRFDGARDIAKIWDLLFKASIPYGRRGIAVMALSGVDNALWDALGRAEGKPVYELAGGPTRQRVRAYGTGIDWEAMADDGFTAIKLNHRHAAEDDIEPFVRMFQKARHTLGDETMLMTDCYMTWDEETTIGMAELLAPYRPYFLEDVCTPEATASQARIRDTIKPALLAGGEHEFTEHGFTELAKAACLDIWQPDITWCGGFTAGMRVAEIAARNNVQVVPHRGGEPWGLHLILATECEDLAECNPLQKPDGPDAVWIGEPAAENGSIEPTGHAGFGVVPAGWPT